MNGKTSKERPCSQSSVKADRCYANVKPDDHKGYREKMEGKYCKGFSEEEGLSDKSKCRIFEEASRVAVWGRGVPDRGTKSKLLAENCQSEKDHVKKHPLF